MSKYLIVNADDFGLSEAVNHGILKAYKEGIVTSTTIMANMPGFEHAIMLAKENPDLPIGVHLTLTTYKPVLKNHQRIITKNGYFRSKDEIDKINTEEAYHELKAQIERVIACGIDIDHFDSHHHIHAEPALKKVIQQLAMEYNLPFRGGFHYKESAIRKSYSNIDFYNEGVTVDTFRKAMQNIKHEEVCDLMCHPAYIDHFLYHITTYAMMRIHELELLCSEKIKQVLKEENITLASYSKL